MALRRKAAPRKAAQRKASRRKSPARKTPRRKAATRGKRRRRPRPDPARVRAILEALDAAYPDSRCSLDHRTAWQLLVATILSAQCTDARVNLVTKELFRRAPDPRRMAALPREEIEELVRSTGFYRNKAKALHEGALAVVERHKGRVPRTMDELLGLPGVARKTANVVLGTAFGEATGVVVDTHVKRITRLLGLTAHEDPARIEEDLMAILPREHWIRFAHQLIDHGRSVCIARRPRCSACVLAPHCPSAS